MAASGGLLALLTCCVGRATSSSLEFQQLQAPSPSKDDPFEDSANTASCSDGFHDLPQGLRSGLGTPKGGGSGMLQSSIMPDTPGGNGSRSMDDTLSLGCGGPHSGRISSNQMVIQPGSSHCTTMVPIALTPEDDSPMSQANTTTLPSMALSVFSNVSYQSNTRFLPLQSPDLISRLFQQQAIQDVSGNSLHSLASELKRMIWLGQGGCGVVFKGEWRGAPVAVKFVVARTEDELAENAQEATFSKILSHPNVVHTYLVEVARVQQEWFDRTSAGAGMPAVGARQTSGHWTSFTGLVLGTSASSTTANPLMRRLFNNASQYNPTASTSGMAGEAAGSGSHGLVETRDLEATFAHSPSTSGAPLPAIQAAMAAASAAGGAGVGSPGGGRAAWRRASILETQEGQERPCSQFTEGGGTDSVPSTPATPWVVSKAGGGVITPTGMRRNSAVSIDNFSVGGSFTAGSAYTFWDALYLNCKAAQYVTVIVMEHCDRGSLHTAISKGMFQPSSRWGKGTALRSLVRTLREVAQGMSYLHQQDIRHGDLKPANVLLKSSRLDKRGFTARVSDFGHCRFRPSERDGGGMTDDGEALPATINYTAPEVLQGRASKASDVYSFGVVVHQMTTGHMPFGDLQWHQVFAGLLAGDLVLEWPEGVHPALARLGKLCLSLDENQRPNFDCIVHTLSRLEDVLKKGGHKASLRMFAPMPHPSNQQHPQQQARTLSHPIQALPPTARVLMQ